MSISSDRSTLARLQNEIAALRKQDAGEAKKEVDATSKANTAAQAANKATSQSTLNMKLREAERQQNLAASAAKKRADIATKISRKTDELNRVQDRLSKAEAAERKKETDRVTKLTRDLERQQRELKAAIPTRLAKQSTNSDSAPEKVVKYDVFISHASEDKESFVRKFAQTLAERGLKVWYDEHSLKWGDSLRREIDQGLANSRFGVVVLSQHFFAKEWPVNQRAEWNRSRAADMA